MFWLCIAVQCRDLVKACAYSNETSGTGSMHSGTLMLKHSYSLSRVQTCSFTQGLWIRMQQELAPNSKLSLHSKTPHSRDVTTQLVFMGLPRTLIWP